MLINIKDSQLAISRTMSRALRYRHEGAHAVKISPSPYCIWRQFN
jgi:hypothetical protein